MWCPPAYVGGCSQVVLNDPEPSLVRNYDYSPRLLEGTWLASRYCGKRVLAMGDCLWGVLDGINEDGLAVSLSFGGRTTVGEGFGIPVVLRYVLEFASTVADAVSLLGRVPVHMSYSVSLVDRTGTYALVFVTPDRPIEVLTDRVATNHQHQPEWQRHATATRSVERESALRGVLASSGTLDKVLDAFEKPPVFQSDYDRGYGTLYTAVYRPAEASAELIWRNLHWRQSCASFAEGQREIAYGEETSQ
jgi:predicted choloylglycine hydrolase